jgi:peptidoglycan/LPS O-acetylase OafA/YrhL
LQYRREVDGLRSIAIIPVLFFHAGVNVFRGGYVGVDIFFVISGYLITSLILAERTAGRFTIVGFYERRARRILPALYVVVMACLIPAWHWMSPEALKSFGQSLVAVSLFANNILLSVTSGYWDLASDEKPLLHTWSLGVEEQYYVVFPLLLALCWRLGRGRLAVLLGILSMLSLGLAEWGWRKYPDANFYLPLSRAWELLSGALVAFALHHRGPLPRNRVLLKNALSLFGFALIAYSIFIFDSYTPFPSLYSAVPILGSALVLYAADEHTVVGAMLSLPVLVGIGLISYSLYLWHQPLLAYARVIVGSEPSLYLSLSLILVAFGLAYLSWKFVEKPFRNRAFMSQGQVFGMALGGSVVFVGLGLAANMSHGFPKRLPAASVAELTHFRELQDQRKKWYMHGCQLSAKSLAMLGHTSDGWGCQLKLDDAKILVVGDSHAEDKAVALRINGIAVDQVIGSDCSLAPSLMAYGCKKKSDALVGSAVLANYQFLLLANRWSDMQEVNAFAAEASYWKQRSAHIVLFGGMPEFGRISDRMANLIGRGMSREDAAVTYRYDSQKVQQIDDALRRIARDQGFTFVDTAGLFCHLSSFPERCIPLLGQDYLVVDYAHLSELGAKMLGKRILQQMQTAELNLNQ